jgi:hypothetical protein
METLLFAGVTAVLLAFLGGITRKGSRGTTRRRLKTSPRL